MIRWMAALILAISIPWLALLAFHLPLPQMLRQTESPNRCAPKDVLYLTHPGAVPQHLLVPTCAPPLP
jgi:hypothetical protein